jgi:hypothetical protein
MRKPRAVIALPVLAALLALSACASSDYSEAEQAGFIRDGIQDQYAAAPQPEWFDSFQEVAVESGVATVQSDLGPDDDALAATMCTDISAVSLDPDGEPMGITTLRIYGTESVILAECDGPTG